jgi:hypothetical protein
MKKFIFDEKSELYATGAVLACLLTGDSVFPRNFPDCSDEVAFDSRDTSGDMLLPEDVARPFACVISECSSTDPKKTEDCQEASRSNQGCSSSQCQIGKPFTLPIRANSAPPSLISQVDPSQEFFLHNMCQVQQQA